MHANSSPISSGQSGIHEHLAAIVARHAASTFQKPITAYNRQAFEASMAAWRNAAGGDTGSMPLILDTGCGVGLSTRHLATQFPDHFVLGIDQSADRLERNTAWHGAAPQNFTLVRADLVDYWRLLSAGGIRPARQYLLYPNPWPKAAHLGRRWHGHAVFPTIVALGGVLECRSNWRIYVEEFAAAVQQLRPSPQPGVEHYPIDTPITPFERKYLASGHSLWRYRAQLA
ncbi:tRNA (guanosine(46)-N(7))-methyltransferase TrmB [Herminiimonas sp. CN]|uniref:tRNA (guanine(46)-N(7))-methyltransferase TrmB n=1 Tax=Herminiimonas sp. CN TaxID=1349818 RepID=UPI0004734641|nr:methyltransferase domain-containing protein [Herminiimonas sp. CN]